MGLEPCRVELRDANAFVAALHRHHKPVRGHRFSLGVQKDGVLVGVAICGRPVARMTNQKDVLEVTRVCTDGTKNACSWLYGAAVRCARDMGFSRVQTFLLEDEPAVTVRAAGFRHDGTSAGGQWVHTSGPRRTDQPTCAKQRWVFDIKEAL